MRAIMSERLKEKEFHVGKTGVYRFQQESWDGWVLHDCIVPPHPIRQYAGPPTRNVRAASYSGRFFAG